MRKRKHWLYLNPISPVLAIFKAPDEALRWADLRREILRALKRDHAVTGYEVSSVEALAGYPPGYPMTDRDLCDEAEGLPRFDAAFTTGVGFRAFYLYAWNSETRSFDLYRKPTRKD